MKLRLPAVLAVPGRLGPRQGLAVGLLVWLVIAAAASLGAFEQLDLRLHDLRYRLRGPVPASDRIALVEVDDATLGAYGSWPLPRATYALLIAALGEARAQAVGVDLLFIGGNPDDPAGDRLLAGVTAGRTDLVHAIAFLPEDASLGGGTSPPTATRDLLVRHGRPVDRQRLAGAMRVSLPYDALLAAADALGHTAVAVDRDGVVRRVPQFVRYGDWIYPSLSIRLTEIAARADATLPQFELASDGVWIHHRGRPRYRMPVDAEGATAIVYAGDRAAFPNTVPMITALQWFRDRDTLALRRAFEGRLVLVGTTAVGEVATDVGPTPFAAAAPLVYIHANALNAALEARFLARPPAWLTLAVLLGLALGLGALFTRLPLGRAAAVVAAVVLAVALADYRLFAGPGLDVPPTAGLALAPLVWVGIEGLRRLVSERQARERERELAVARTIQQRLLPSKPPDLPGLDIHGVNVPAEAVGGDYFDWVPVGEHQLAVVLGDVSGHGVPAALLMSHLRASFHAEARDGASASEIVHAVHRSLSRAVESGRFATFFLALIDRQGPALAYCNAGHNPPLVAREAGVEELPATGIPLAMIEMLGYTEGRAALAPGDTLLVFSDGVPEWPRGDDFYGDERMRERFLALVAEGRDARGIVEGLLADVRAWARGSVNVDDVTLVVVRRT